MYDRRCYKRYYYINGEWLEDPQDPPKDYDLAIFVCNKSEAADILKNKVSDSIIKNIKDNENDNIQAVIKAVFEDYNYHEDYNYQYISLFKLSNRKIDNKNIDCERENTNLITPKIINMAIVIFEKEFYVFADDNADDKLIDWINRVVDMFKQDAADKFKQEKRVLGSIFIYHFLFASMSDLNSMLKDLYGAIYHYSKQSSKQSITIIGPKVPNPKDQKIQINLMKNLFEIKDLILELRIYLTYIKEVLRKIRPLFRETSEYYNKLSDIKEKCDDGLYKIEENMQSTISITFHSASLRQTKDTRLLTAISTLLIIITILHSTNRIHFDDSLYILLTIIMIIIAYYYI